MSRPSSLTWVVRRARRLDAAAASLAWRPAAPAPPLPARAHQGRPRLLAVVLAIAYPYPLISGEVMPDVRPLQPSAHVRVPQYWRTMANTIDADTRPGKVLVLPLDDYYQMPTTWGFFGVDSIANLLIQHPVITLKPDGYFGDTGVPGRHPRCRDRAAHRRLRCRDAAAGQHRGIEDRAAPRFGARPANRSFADDKVLGAAISRCRG